MRRTDAIVGVALVLAASFFASPVLRNLTSWSANSDWHFITAAPAAARNTIVRYHELPLWNPFLYGGVTAIGYPRSSFLSPLFVLPLALGIYPGIKIKYVLTTVLCALGAYRMGRRMDLEEPAAALCAVVYSFSSVVPLWMYCGAPQHTTAWVIPWLWSAFHDATRPARSIPNRPLVVAGLLLLLMFVDGSVYYTMFAALLVGASAVAAGIGQRRAGPVLAAATMLVVAAVAGAVKAVPVYETSVKYPRKIAVDLEYVSLRTQALDATLGRDQLPGSTHFDRDQLAEAARQGKIPWEWWEYGAYIGVVPGLLVLAGFVLLPRRDPGVLVLLLLSALLSVGYASPIDLWRGLHGLPGFSEMQFPTRAVILAVFLAAIVAGKSAQVVLSRLESSGRSRRWSGAVAWTIVLLVFADMASVSRPILAGIFRLPPARVERLEFAQTRQVLGYGGIINASFVLVESNVGAIVTQPDLPMPRSAIGIESEFYRGEVFLRDSRDRPRARVTAFAPNRVAVAVDADRPDLLVLNQNFDDGWSAVIDGSRRPAVPFKGLLKESILRENYHDSESTDPYLRTSIPYRYGNGLVAVSIEPGPHEVVFRYSPRSFWIGAGVSLVAMALLALFLANRVGPRALVAALALLGVVVVGSALEIRARCAAHQEHLRLDHEDASGR